MGFFQISLFPQLSPTPGIPYPPSLVQLRVPYGSLTHQQVSLIKGDPAEASPGGGTMESMEWEKPPKFHPFVPWGVSMK